VWPLDERELKVPPFDVRDRPRMRLIAGLDSGFQNSYTAIVWIAYDEAERTAYVVDCEKVRRQLVKDIAPLIKDRDYHYGFEVPVAWPRDISRRRARRD
jgi:phage terminase large subunit